MTGQEATLEVAWIARRARYLVHAPYDPAEHVEYFERKATLLEHMAQSDTMTPASRASSARLAGAARLTVTEHRRRLVEALR